MNKVTIRDVAAAAGVSHQTVSRVLNERPDVAPDTRDRVLQVMQQMGYRPSAIARSLTQRRSFTIGVVTAGLSYIGPSRTLNGLTAQAERLGYALLLKELPGFASNNVQPLLNSLMERRVDGVVWAVPEVGDNRAWLADQAASLPVPTVFLTMQARPDVLSVSIDNYAGGRMATEHLLQQGYRRIAHITGPLDWWEARERQAGWRDAMLAAGVPEAELVLAEGDWSSDSGEQAIRRLLAGHLAVEAVFAANDQMALSVLQVACREEIQVPQKLGVVGFDGVPESAHYWPPLTTIYQDQPELGRLALLELVEWIEAGQRMTPRPEPQAISVEPELVVRASSLRHPA